MRSPSFIVVSKISIHALREEGDRARSCACRCDTISIHALREEGDKQQRSDVLQQRNFYPRPPRGGRRALRSSS